MLDLSSLMQSYSPEVQESWSSKFSNMGWRSYRDMSPFSKLEYHIFLSFQELGGGEETMNILKKLETYDVRYKVSLEKCGELLLFKTMTDTAIFLDDSVSRVSKYYNKVFKGYKVIKCDITHIINDENEILEVITHC